MVKKLFVALVAISLFACLTACTDGPSGTDSNPSELQGSGTASRDETLVSSESDTSSGVSFGSSLVIEGN